MIERYVGDIADPVYLADPPAMIAAMATLLETIGARIKNIRAEAFVGY